MPPNFQKTPAGLSIQRFTRSKARDQIAQTTQSWPCIVTARTGSIVTASFQVQAAPGKTAVTVPSVTMPLIGSEYVRLPLPDGCKGVALKADADLGGMSGLGGGVATLGTIGNLTALAFAPVGNTSFVTVDPNTLVLYGEPGVRVQDKTNAAAITVQPTGIVMSLGANTITISSTGIVITGGGHTVSLTSAGVTIDGRVFLEHEHTGVTTGSGVSGGVV